MRIVLLTQWYPPEPLKLLSDMACGLQAAGHDVTVLTGFPNYPSGKLFPGYRVKFWQKEMLDGIPVVRVPLYPNHDRSSIKRIVNYVSFAGSAAMLGAALIRRPDIIHAYHPPLTVGWPAWQLSRLWRVPFTYEIQDMWPEALTATGMISNNRALRCVGWFAKRLYRRAAAIRVISPGFRQNLIDKGVPPEKIHVISNAVDVDFYRPMPPDAALAERLGLSGKFVVMFAGNIGIPQGVDTILDAAARLRDLPEVLFAVVGDGVEYDRVRTAAQARGLDNVRFLGRYPPAEMPSLYALADVLLLHLRDDHFLYRITIPHKVFSYLASGKPVLAAVKGDAADVVVAADAGLDCAPSDPQAMADSVRRFVKMTASERQAMGDRGRNVACTQYNNRAGIAALERMLQEAVGSKSAVRPLSGKCS
jgi:colanic acid biosynthesis glycosyl transferase WcaI